MGEKGSGREGEWEGRRVGGKGSGREGGGVPKRGQTREKDTTLTHPYHRPNQNNNQPTAYSIAHEGPGTMQTGVNEE